MCYQGATVPGAAGVMRGLEALADAWSGRLRSSGAGGEGGRGMGRAVTDGPSSMLAGRMLSQVSHCKKATWVPSVAKDTGDAIR